MVVMRRARADCRCISRRGPKFGPGKKTHYLFPTFSYQLSVITIFTPFYSEHNISDGCYLLFFWHWRLQIHIYRGLEEIVLRLESWMHSENKIIVFWSYQLYGNLPNNYCLTSYKSFIHAVFIRYTKTILFY